MITGARCGSGNGRTAGWSGERRGARCRRLCGGGLSCLIGSRRRGCHRRCRRIGTSGSAHGICRDSNRGTAGRIGDHACVNMHIPYWSHIYSTGHLHLVSLLHNAPYPGVELGGKMNFGSIIEEESIHSVSRSRRVLRQRPLHAYPSPCSLGPGHSHCHGNGQTNQEERGYPLVPSGVHKTTSFF